MFSFPADHTGRPQQTLSNKPMRQQLVKEIQQQLDELMKIQLPSYMVPRSIQVLETLPINQNGKVDRKALIQRARTNTVVSQDVLQRDLSTAELKIQQILLRVLGIQPSRIGLEDSFFYLGGDSIAAMKIVAAAREQDIELTVANIFQHPKLVNLATVAQFAQHAAEEKPTQPFSFLSTTQRDHLLHAIPANALNVNRNDVVDILPTTWMQNLFISRGVNIQPLAFNYFFLDLGTRVDASRLRRSIPALVQHFSILRTRFVYVDGVLWQAVLRNPDVPFTEFQLDTSLDEAADTVCLENSRTADPLELPTAFMLVRSAEDQYRLVFRITHAQYDGVCFPSFVKALFAFYSGKPVEPSPSHSTYLACVQSTKLASAAYWRNLLQDSRITQATPLLGPNIRHELSPIEVQTENIISMPEVPTGFTLASLVSSAWAKVLSRISGEEDVVYGYMVAGRNANVAAISKVVGPCLNIIPVRARVQPETTSTELVRSIQEQYVALGEADSMGFDDIVRTCTDWPANTHYDSVFQHQNLDEHPEFDFEGTTSRLHWFQNPDSVPVILTVVSFPLKDKLKIVVRGNEHIITPANSDMINELLCDMISKVSSSLQML